MSGLLVFVYGSSQGEGYRQREAEVSRGEDLVGGGRWHCVHIGLDGRGKKLSGERGMRRHSSRRYQRKRSRGG